ALLAAVSWTSAPAQAMPLSAPTALKGAADEIAVTDKVNCWDGCYRPSYGYYRPWRPYYGYSRPWRPYYAGYGYRPYRPYYGGYHRPYYRPYYAGYGYGYRPFYPPYCHAYCRWARAGARLPRA